MNINSKKYKKTNLHVVLREKTFLVQTLKYNAKDRLQCVTM